MVKLEHLFKIEYGTNLELNKLNIMDNHVYEKTVNFVSRTSKNNGVSAIVEKVDNKSPYSPGLITVSCGGSVLESFVQINSFYTGRDMYVLTPIESMTLQEKIYYCMCIRANKYKYNYGRQANSTLRDMMVPDKKDIPQWVYDLELPNFDNNKRAFNDSDSKLELNTENYKEFKIVDLFNLSKGKYYPKSSYSNGITPLVSASETNNGVSDYTDLKPVYEGNCLTLGKVKMTVFYQDAPFCCSHDVTVLEPKFRFNQYIGMFIKVILEQDQYRYNYGRQIQLNVAKTIKLKLPVDKNGEPDWDFMENYIKQLPYSSSI